MPNPSLPERRCDKKPWIIAHRGDRVRYPENTMAAFRAAFAARVDMIEMDVQLTLDRRMVIIHDPSLERTTDGTGRVNGRTLEELKSLDAGRWFDVRFSREPVPTPEEVFDLFGGKVLINIEIKREAFESEGPADAVERQLVALIERRGLLNSVLVSSFEWGVLESIRRRRDDVFLAFITRNPGEEGLPEHCRALGIFSLHPNWLFLREEHVQRMHEAGIPVFPYRVDKADEFRCAMTMGVDGVISNDPLIGREAQG
ncbi:MAG: glycerophosphodiester phosphodiesterase family protein [Syntrophales bacterium]|nr:glycerophosphodiester phosphodiesterase family protein [Syntrophales bacterium]